MVVKDFDNAYLFCFPLKIEKNLKTAAEIKCIQLIWLKCCYTHSFSDVIITKRDRERIALTRLSYINGLESLSRLGIITVDRHSGRSNRISVNTTLLDQKSMDTVLRGRK
jgi:hypothetical protein